MALRARLPSTLFLLLMIFMSATSCGVKMTGPLSPIGESDPAFEGDALPGEDSLSQPPVVCKDDEVINNGACMPKPARCMPTEVYLAYLDQCVASTPENICFSKGQVRQGDGCVQNAYYGVCILKTGRTVPQDNTVAKLKLVVADNTCEGSYTKLAQLTSLDMSEVQKDVDLRVISDFTQLEELISERNLLTSATGIEKLKNLTALNLSDNAITNVTAIGGLVLLEDLDLEDNGIDDISALRTLKKLVTVDLSSNEISSLVALSALTALEKIDLNDNGDLADLRPLRGLLGLESLRIEDTDVSSLAPLVNLPLTTLDIAGSTIAGLTFAEVSEAICPVTNATSQILATTCATLMGL